MAAKCNLVCARPARHNGGLRKQPMDARSSRYHDVYAQWQRNPEAFWAEAAAGIYGRWFTGASCYTCYNALDRHVAAGRNDQLALIYDSPVTNTVKTFTY